MDTLTTLQRSILRHEITTDPTGKGYQAWLAEGKPGYVIDILNAPTHSMRKETWLTDFGLMSRLGVDMGRSILTKLKAISAADIAVAAAFARLQGNGIDVGDPETVSMIDQLALAQGGFTTAEQDALKGLSMHPASRMEILGLPYAQEQMLRDL